MREFTDHDLTVRAFDANVWLQERNLLRVTDTSSQEGEQIKLYRVTGLASTTTLIATYTVDRESEVVIDLTDYIRVHAGDSDRRVMVENRLGNYVVIDFTVIGLINPANVLIPGTVSGIIIEPPSVMFRQLFRDQKNAVAMEFYTSSDITVYTESSLHIVKKTVKANTPTTINSNSMDEVRFGTYKIRVKELDECKRYVAVRWVSFTGQTRLNVWELRDATQSADEAIKLETLDGSYNQIKGRTDGFKLYLDELTAYDYWYYSDIITSSKVEVMLDGQTWNQVEVTTKSATIPNTNQGNMNKLEIAVNWRNYDAVTM